MISHMPPGLIMILAAFLLPVIPHVWRQIYMLGAIALSAYGLFLGAGTHLVWTVLGLDLILYQADALSLPFAIIFHLAAALNVIYSWHDRDWQQHCASLSYAGAARWLAGSIPRNSTQRRSCHWLTQTCCQYSLL